jgi:hypothetical protein
LASRPDYTPPRPHQHEAQTWPAANDRLDPPSRAALEADDFPHLHFFHRRAQTFLVSMMIENLSAAG